MELEELRHEAEELRELRQPASCGRCVSTDRNVFASLRVMPGAWITGRAAGTAAALALKNSDTPRSVDPGKLRSVLKKQGAFFR